MYAPCAPTLAAVREERKTLCDEEGLNDMREDAKNKEEHLYSVMRPAQFNQAVTPISPVFICPHSFSRPQYNQHLLLVTIVSQSSPIQKKTSNPLRLPVLTSLLILSSTSSLLFLSHHKDPLIQLSLTRHPPLFYNLLATP